MITLRFLKYAQNLELIMYERPDIRKKIELSCVGPATTQEAVEQACREVEYYGFVGLSVFNRHLDYAVDVLHAKRIPVIAVISYPLGVSSAQTKLYESQEAVSRGADILEVSMPLGLCKTGEGEKLYHELAAIIVETQASVRAVIELAALDEREIALVVEVALDAGVQGIKTGSGFGGIISADKIRALAALVKNRVPIKASGGVNELQQGYALLEAGAQCLGTSKGAALVDAQRKQGAGEAS
jgi:deoxyribose-phosphate aldolase